MHILFAASDSYVRHLGVCLLSVLRTQAPEADLSVHVFHHDITAENQAKIATLKAERSFDLRFYDIDPGDFAGHPGTLSHVTGETYFRLKAHELLGEIDRVLYLDVDLIVCADLGDLWQIDLEGNLAGAIYDYSIDGSPPLRYYGLMPRTLPCFNAGVLLLDLGEMRRIGIDDTYRQIARKWSSLMPYSDQDMLNIAFKNRVRWLPLKYNVQSNFYYRPDALSVLQRFAPDIEPAFSEALAAPAILHYTGREKPWHIGSRHPMTNRYLEVERSSPWRDEPLLVDTLRYRPHPMTRAYRRIRQSLFGGTGRRGPFR